ncbi:PKS-NRPS hybrid synthetase cheA-like [Rhododendron vialii]|uniref:PKS-NRPS hybrid synthetase cheA-like n=1 Tax=Rhododendron vialii TaxID=182163 RepID=UPI00265F30B3|nr:PKS-NRPS hybrid synthetase cheA-like [Rhododendron vialii]
MDIEQAIECVIGISSDRIEQERIVAEGNEIEENRQNDILGQLGWKFQSREELLGTLRDFFSMQGKRHADGFWVLEVKNSSHNHEPSSDMSGHPSCRRLSKEEIMSIEKMTRSGVPPRQILSSLRQGNPKLQAISRTIYNMKVKLKNDNLAGRTMIQALFEELCQGDFTFYVAHDQNGHLTHLFFAHPSSIALTRSYTTVFVMDCTYKTNRYKMQLLDIVGVSSFNNSFYSCFVFLAKEGEEDYVWALQMFRKILGPACYPTVIVFDRELALMNAIKVVFPTTTNLLCVWHIEKNILANCKSHFKTQEDWTTFLDTWNEVISSPDGGAFDEAWKLFELLYNEKEYVLSYIQRTWLPFKERFVKAWTEKCAHFGNRVSSRAEGAHGKLKKYLQVSTGDLHQVK